MFSFRAGQPVYAPQPTAAWKAPVLTVRSARAAALIAEGERLPADRVWRPPFPTTLDDYSERASVVAVAGLVTCPRTTG